MPDNFDWQSDNNDFDNDDGQELSLDDLRYAPMNEPDSDPTDSNESDNVIIEETRNEPRTFEDLTLAELVSQFWRSPGRTGRALMTITRSPRSSEQPAVAIPSPMPSHAKLHRHGDTSDISDQDSNLSPSFPEQILQIFTRKLSPQQIQLVLYMIAVVVGIIGSSLLLGPGDVRRSEANALVVGAPFLWMAFFLWLGAELYGNWGKLVDWWTRIDRLAKVHHVLRIIPVFVWLTALLLFTDAMTAPAELTLGFVQVAIGRVFLGIVLWLLIEVLIFAVRRIARNNLSVMSDWVDVPEHGAKQTNLANYAPEPIWQQITLKHSTLFILASFCSLLVWQGTPNNRISPPIIILWIISAILWSLTFVPQKSSVFDWATGKLDAFRRIDWRANLWAVIAFMLIMILAIGFRFTQLDSLPPEMTSDHLEKILDANRVYNGDYNIFFANNGGREPLQMYLMSLFTTLPGLDFNHYTLKLLAALESLIAMPVLVWLGVELVGRRNRRFGLVVGLLLAGLVAVSYWHVAITRQALRIVMMPTVTALLLIYLARAMRYNHRSDYIKAALILGFGLYVYQAVRMLPVVVVIGIAIAVIIRNITWRERLKYGVNLAVLVWISFMVFLPMFHYSTEDPDHFWKRTAGRILGDDLITQQLEDGTIIERQSTPEERIAAFNANVPVLMTNIRNAVLMFNWKGDVGWISGVPNEPAMDIYTGTLFVLGLAAWIAMMLRSRDPVIWLIPIMIFIMLLPSALSIAYPLENPSHTRTSGAIPPAYLVAALPLALIAFRFAENFSRRVGLILAVVFCSGVILLANQRNTSLYFNQYPAIYIESSYPYSEAGDVLRGFAQSGGSFGNAFMIAYPHWWGHREMGVAAGKPWWPNGIVNRQDLPGFLNIARSRNDEFQLDPDKDLLFFFSPDDEETSLLLKEWFPEGREQEIQSYQWDDNYRLYRVPFLGDQQLIHFIATYQ